MWKADPSASSLACRDIDDVNFRRVQGADPTQNQDLVTKQYHDAAQALNVPSSRQIATTEGVQGGGDLSADRTLRMDIDGLTPSPGADAANDSIAIFDDDLNEHRKLLLQDIPGIGGLTVPPTRQVNTTEGIQGGGDLSVDRTHRLDIDGLLVSPGADDATDYIVIYDDDIAQHRKLLLQDIPGLGGSGEANTGANVGAGVGVFRDKTTTVLNFRSLTALSARISIAVNGDEIEFDVIEGQIDHDSLSGFVANEHIDHSAVSINTSEGIQGGGDITATRNLTLDIDGLTLEASVDGGNDTVAIWDDSAGAHRKVNLEDLSSSLVHFGNDNLAPSTVVRWLSPGGENRTATVAQVGQMVMPKAGRLRNMYVRHGSPTAPGTLITYTVFKNNVAQALLVSLAANGTVASDLANTVTVVAGDEIEIQVTKAAGLGGGNGNVEATLTMEYTV